MKGFVFLSEAYTPQAALERFKRHIIPILTVLLGKDASKEITINENHMCINGTPVGDYRFMSNFEIDCGGLKFDYGNDKFRIVCFDFFNDCKIDTIAEFNKNGGYKIIYER